MWKKIARFLFRFIIITLAITILLLLVFDHFVQFRMDDDALKKYFAQRNVSVSVGYYKSFNRTIRYAFCGTDTSATLVFIHGAPSSLSYFRDYMTDSSLLHKATMYAIDRPGYGYSGLAQPVPCIEKQVRMIVPMIDSLHKVHHPIILVATSYGAAIACRLAVDHPEMVDGLVLIGPALAPGEEKFFWFTYIVENPLIKWTVPRMLQSANKEKIYHKKELMKMLPLWKNLRIPVIYMQGANDWLVYTSNAVFAKQHFTNVPYLDIEMIPGKGHLIAFSEKDKICAAILKMITLAEKKRL